MSQRLPGSALAVVAMSVLLVTAAQAQTRLIRQVIASGATASASPQYLMAGTVGQTIIGRSTSSSHIGALGFWYTYPHAYTTSVREELSWLPTGPIATLSVSPNPVTTSATIAVALPLGGHVSLRLYDQLGQERLTLIDDEREAGSRTLTLPAAGLESGEYTLVLATGTTRVIERLRVVR